MTNDIKEYEEFFVCLVDMICSRSNLPNTVASTDGRPIASIRVVELGYYLRRMYMKGPSSKLNAVQIAWTRLHQYTAYDDSDELDDSDDSADSTNSADDSDETMESP